MIALYILAGLLLLLLLPVGVRFRYAQGECRVTVRYAGIPVWRFSSKQAKKKKAAKKAAKTDRSAEAKNKKKKKSAKTAARGREALSGMTARLKEEGVSALAAYLRELARLLTGTLRRLARVLRFGHCTLLAAVAAQDASATALRYGRLCGPVQTARALLEDNLRIRRLDFAMCPDFRREKDAIYADIRLHVCPLRALGAAIRTLAAGVGTMARLQNAPAKRKEAE